MPEVRIDAVAQGDALSLDLAEELQQLAPFGMGNPAVSLLVPAATMSDPRGDRRGPPRLVHAQRRRRAARAAWPSAPATRCRSARTSPPTPPSAWRSTAGTAPSRPKLVLRQAQPVRPRAIEVVGEPATFAGRALRARAGDAATSPRGAAGARGAQRLRLTRDLRGTGHRRHPRRPRRVRRARARRDRARAASGAQALADARRRLRGHLVGGAGGRSRRSRAPLPARRRRRPAHTAAAGPSGRGGLDPPGVGYA